MEERRKPLAYTAPLTRARRRSVKTYDPTPQQKFKTPDPTTQQTDAHTPVDPNMSEEDESGNMEIDASNSSKESSTQHTSSEQHQDVSCLSYTKFNYILILLIIITGIFIVGLLIFSNNNILKNVENDMIPGPIDHLNLAMDLIDEMENDFPLQNKETWTSFLSALSSVVEQEEPSQPAVLLFVGGNTLIETHTMQCVALTLANNTNKLLPAMNSVNTVSSEITVQVDKFVNLQNQETIKKELDTRMRSILNKSYSVVVGPLEKIPPGAALLLHGYCDNFVAPFKKRVIILTATFDSERPLNSKQLESRLNTLWYPELDIDQSASIVSRIANNVVFIEPETGPIPCTV